jgi:integrase
VPRPRQDGPKRIVKQLKDGTTWAYLYDRRTGAAIGREQVLESTAVRPGTMSALIKSYRDSARFKSRKPGTRNTYGYTLDYLDATIGDLPIRAIAPATVQAIKEELAATPSKANQVLALLSILFKGAKKQGLVFENPAEDPGKLPVQPRIEIWSREEEARYIEAFRPRLQLMFGLMLYTLQRLSDVLAMTLNQVTEQNGRLYVVLRQSKTDELVGIPVHASLETLLRQRLAEDVTIAEKGTDRQIKSLLLVPSPHGLKWTRRNASRAWDHDLAIADRKLADELKTNGWVPAKIKEEIAKRHRQRRDLRRTGIVRMAEGGATTPQIAAVSGHQIDYCQRIIDTYLPRRTEVALGGIEAWEAAEKSGPRVVRLSDAVALESRAQKRRDKG